MIRLAKKADELIAEYLEELELGKRATCHLERAMVRRHKRDLEEAPERGWCFKPSIARQAIEACPAFIRHTTGKWGGEPFTPSPWQAFLMWQLYGWRSVETKGRRFRKCYLTMARKNGKTFLGAAISVLNAFCDLPLEPRAEIWCAATKEAQAKILWNEARRIIQASPSLAKHAVIRPSKNLIELPGKPWCETTIKPVGADARRIDGLNPTLVVKDELHAWNHTLRDLDEKLSTGGGSRISPLELIITTAGDESSELWLELHEWASKVVAAGAAGTPLDDRLLAFICQVDDEVDPFSSQAHEQANPNIDVSVSREYLETQAAEARLRPSVRKAYMRYHVNRQVVSFERAFPEELWSKGNQTFEVADGDECYLGFDLGRTNDWAAIAAVFPQFVDGAWRFAIHSRAFACAGTNPVIDYTKPPFSEWIESDLMDYQAKESLETGPLEEWLLDYNRKYYVKECAFDATFAGDLANRLASDHSIEMFSFFQTPKRYTAPIKRLEKELTAGRIGHGGDLVLAWQALNAETVDNKRGEIMIDKGKQSRRNKIDAAVAVLMAFGEAIYHLQNDTSVGYVHL